MNTPSSRRHFLKTAAAFAGIQFLPSGIVSLHANQGANSKVNMAFVGVGGRGKALWSSFRGQNFVGFCDIDSREMIEAASEYPDTPRYSSYQTMLEELDGQIDAVVIATPDHTHFEIAKAAMEMGKHVYVEKPLAQSVAQVRQLKALAEANNLVTQMGNQGHSTGSIRTCREVVQAGLLGPVHRVQCWTDRPVNWWPQGFDQIPAGQPIPEQVDWNTWLGICQGSDYAYSNAIHRFKWRGFQAFGTGALGDMACHIMDAAFWSLDLGSPTSVTAEISDTANNVSYPVSSKVTYRFPARGEMPAVELIWTDGEYRPERPEQIEADRQMGNPSGGSLIEGEIATMMGDSHSEVIRIIPETLHKEMEESFPERSIPRVRSHWHDFINAIHEGRQPSASIQEYSGALTETVLLGALAQRFPNEVLEYDAANMAFTNHAEATEVLTNPHHGVAGFPVAVGV